MEELRIIYFEGEVPYLLKWNDESETYSKERKIDSGNLEKLGESDDLFHGDSPVKDDRKYDSFAYEILISFIEAAKFKGGLENINAVAFSTLSLDQNGKRFYLPEQIPVKYYRLQE